MPGYERISLITLRWLVLLVIAGVEPKSTREISKIQPHVVLIMADDLGWSDVSWNNPNVVMPHLNTLATEGTILSQSYVQPTCTPSRASLMSGKYPFTMGLQQGVIRPTEPRGLPLNVKTLPQKLKRAGYSTHAIGKWHLGFCSWDYTPTRRGFDTFYGFYNGATDYYTHKADYKVYKKGKDKGKDLANEKGKNKGKDRLRRKDRPEYLDLRNGTKVDASKEGIYSTHLFASEAERILKSRNPKDPMFMFLSFQSVHSPLQVPPEYTEPYKNVIYEERRTYLGMITAMDEAVGKVVAALKETGHYENSVIIFTSDNGATIKKGGSNWPLRAGKNTLWEGGVRTPAFIYSSHLSQSGNVYSQLHHIVDWYSTILGIAGSTFPSVDGVNHWDALAGITEEPPRTGIIHNIIDAKKFKAGVRLNDYKLLIGGMALTSWASPPTSIDGPLIPDVPEPAPETSSETPPEISPPGTKSTANTRSSSNGKFTNPFHEQLKKISDGFQRISVYPEISKYRDTDYIRWKHVKRNRDISFQPQDLDMLNAYLKNTAKIRLYNIAVDPQERTNLSKTEMVKLQPILSYLARQLGNYKPAVRMKDKSRGHPSYWSDVWSPGWCVARY